MRRELEPAPAGEGRFAEPGLDVPDRGDPLVMIVHEVRGHGGGGHDEERGKGRHGPPNAEPEAGLALRGGRVAVLEDLDGEEEREGREPEADGAGVGLVEVGGWWGLCGVWCGSSGMDG